MVNLKRYFKLKKMNGELDNLHPIQMCIIKLFDKLHYVKNSYRDKNGKVYFYLNNNFYYSDLVLFEVKKSVKSNDDFDLLIRDLFEPIFKKPILHKAHWLLFCNSELSAVNIPDSFKADFSGGLVIPKIQ